MNSIDRRFLLIGIFTILLINEYTLLFFDRNPPLNQNIKDMVRLFDLSVIILSLTSRIWINLFSLIIQKTSLIIMRYVLPTCILVLILDVFLSILGFGYPSHYNQENMERFPYPADTFRGKSNVLDHNEYGFRGDFSTSKNIYNVAIFGGSTTYAGNPPIIDMTHEKLESEGFKINTFNFGSVSSNHTQHVYRLLEFSDKYKFDLIIFYGGGNESLQYASYDPRPGYPYNFFFRNELSPFMQTIIRYSSIVGSIDMFTGGSLSGLATLRKETLSDDWKNKVVSQYWRDLSKAKNITEEIIEPNLCKKTSFISIMQPGNPETKIQVDIWNELIKSQSIFKMNWTHIDLSNMHNKVEFTDIIHITQRSRKIISDELSRIVRKVYSEKCL